MSMLQAISHLPSILHVLALAVLFSANDGGHNALNTTSYSSHEINNISWGLLQRQACHYFAILVSLGHLPNCQKC